MPNYKLLLLAALFMSGPALAEEVEPRISHPEFFKGQSDGWFWYKDPKEAPKKKTPEPPLVEQKAIAINIQKNDSKVPFSVAWLKEAMPRLQEAAIDNPTPENVSAYLYAQRVALDKSQNYAEMTQQVVGMDPFLDENNRIPIASFASAQFDRSVTKGKEDALKHIATRAGIWVFYDSTCTFCGPQANQVLEISQKYGFNTKYISMDNRSLPGSLSNINWVKESGQAKSLKVTLTPTTILVVPPNNYLVVSQGLMSQEALADRLILAAKSNNILPPEILAGVSKSSRGVLKTEDLLEGASDDPKTWIERLKNRLYGRY